MDVVKKNIESLRGQVEIRSEYGSGSIFKMSLPLTLAIIDGMVVRVGSETYESLGETMKNIPGISGGAIMPDGRVGLIIDVGGLVKYANDGHIAESKENVEAIPERVLAA